MNMEDQAKQRIVDVLSRRTDDDSNSPYAHFFSPNGCRLCTSTDGVGTKVALCEEFDIWDTIGIDLVAMSVNDIICTGATPYQFVNHIAVEQAIPDREEQIARGILDGLEDAVVSSAGGEYSVEETIQGVHLSGTCVGYLPQYAATRMGTPNPSFGEPGDVLLGLESSGIHSNGLTLARRVVAGDLRMDLLTPTAIYANVVDRMMRDSSKRRKVKAMSHITGGGFLNLLRVTRSPGTPSDTAFGVVIDDLPSWNGEAKSMGLWDHLLNIDIPHQDLYSTFNMGIGFVLVLRQEDVEEFQREFSQSHIIGYVREEPGVEVRRNDIVLCTMR